MGMDDAGAGRRGGRADRRPCTGGCRSKVEAQIHPGDRRARLERRGKRAYRLADNQLAARASWDPEQLCRELRELEFAGFDLDLIGFERDQLDTILAGWGRAV